MKNDILKFEPAIFAVGNTYQIMLRVNKEVLMWVRIGDKCYYSHTNGTLKSSTNIHRIIVPQKALDNAKKYSVCYRAVIERMPYFTKTEDEESLTFNFTPVSDNNAKAYLIADAHNDSELTVGAVKQFEKKNGPIDFLILAGDIPDVSHTVENFDTIYEIVEQVTHGEKPVAYAKGNHDLRGICAEKMDDYTPISNGNSYFSFRIGNIWGLSLDCGEDKMDFHEAYGHTVCCHEFRIAETQFIKDIIKNSDNEYDKEDVKHKIVIVHNPFSELLDPPFDIEQEIYKEWCELLKNEIKPEIMICGHLHKISVNEPGCEKDHLGQPCRIVVGSEPYRDENDKKHYIGTGFFFSDNGITFEFNDETGKTY